MPDWAVLTGDIVKSRALETGTLSAIFDRLGTAGDEIARWQGTPAHLTRTRGDGWQLLVAPRWLPRAIALCRAAVRSEGKTCTTRIGAGLGEADVPGTSLADATGSALVAAGEALDTMRRNRQIAMTAPPLALAMSLPLIDQISGDWTARQAEVAAHALALPRGTQDELARQLGVTQQTVQAQMTASGAEPLLIACEAWEAV